MRILIDTSVLVRLSHLDSPHALSAAHAVKQITVSEHEGCVVPQVLYEYWVVVTRPVAQNGLGLLASQAEEDLAKFFEQYTLLLDERKIFIHWQQLVSEYHVIGKNAHDTRLVAAMQRHAIRAILTLNAAILAVIPVSWCIRQRPCRKTSITLTAPQRRSSFNLGANCRGACKDGWPMGAI